MSLDVLRDIYILLYNLLMLMHEKEKMIRLSGKFLDSRWTRHIVIVSFQTITSMDLCKTLFINHKQNPCRRKRIAL